jgi:hypothetical protein
MAGSDSARSCYRADLRGNLLFDAARAVFVLVSLSAPAAAQESRDDTPRVSVATRVTRVTDISGAPIPGLALVLCSTDGTPIRTFVTNRSGHIDLGALADSGYTWQLEHASEGSIHVRGGQAQGGFQVVFEPRVAAPGPSAASGPSRAPTYVLGAPALPHYGTYTLDAIRKDLAACPALAGDDHHAMAMMVIEQSERPPDLNVPPDLSADLQTFIDDARGQLGAALEAAGCRSTPPSK